MTLRLPPERPLPDADAVLREVLDDVANPGRRARRAAVSRWALPLVAAVVVALVALGAIGLLGGRRPSAIPAGPGTGALSSGPTPSTPVAFAMVGTTGWPLADVTLEPPGDRRPALSASAAVAAYCGKGACLSRGELKVSLGLATTHGSGTARADGSIAPLIDPALVYALQWQQTTCFHSGCPHPRAPDAHGATHCGCRDTGQGAARSGHGRGERLVWRERLVPHRRDVVRGGTGGGRGPDPGHGGRRGGSVGRLLRR